MTDSGGDGTSGAPDAGRTLAPDEAFSALANETRMAILRTLWEAIDHTADSSALSFSELYDRVGAGDSGRFNYHLGKLRDHFVRRTDDGYELTDAGLQVVQTVVRGTPTSSPVLDPAPVDADCPQCGATVTLGYDGEQVVMRCSECEGYWDAMDGTVGHFTFPPVGLRCRDHDDILLATFPYIFTSYDVAAEGVCATCSAPIEGTLTVCEDHDASEGPCQACGTVFRGLATWACSTCKSALRAPGFAPVLSHQATTSLYHHHGVDLREEFWEVIVSGRDVTTDVWSTDPPRLRVEVAVGGDPLVADVDEDLAVTVREDPTAPS